MSKFEQMVIKFLPTLKLEKQTADPSAGLVADIASLKDEIETIQSQMKKRKKSASVLAPVLMDLAEQLEAAEKELAMTPEASKHRPTMAERKRIAAMASGSNDEREELRQAIRRVIRRIDVKPVKLAPKKNALVMQIEFSDGSKAVGIEANSYFIQHSKTKTDPFRVTAQQLIAAEKKIKKATCTTLQSC